MGLCFCWEAPSQAGLLFLQPHGTGRSQLLQRVCGAMLLLISPKPRRFIVSSTPWHRSITTSPKSLWGRDVTFSGWWEPWLLGWCCSRYWFWWVDPKTSQTWKKIGDRNNWWYKTPQKNLSLLFLYFLILYFQHYTVKPVIAVTSGHSNPPPPPPRREILFSAHSPSLYSATTKEVDFLLVCKWNWPYHYHNSNLIHYHLHQP